MYYLIILINNKEYCLALKNSKCKHYHFHCQAEKRNKIKPFIWEHSKVLSKSKISTQILNNQLL